ncbi:hypothetical protein Ancab_004075, partial [Ancistrocladus abbreviatus]
MAFEVMNLLTEMNSNTTPTIIHYVEEVDACLAKPWIKRKRSKQPCVDNSMISTEEENSTIYLIMLALGDSCNDGGREEMKSANAQRR